MKTGLITTGYKMPPKAKVRNKKVMPKDYSQEELDAANELTNQRYRNEKGHFLPGNPLWKLNALAEGENTRVPVISPDIFAQTAAQYMQHRIDNDKPITKSGLAVALGIGVPTLYEYGAGNRGETEDDRRAYVAVWTLVQSVVEDELETALTASKGTVSGVVFRLTNQFGDRWRSEKHVKHEVSETKEIRIVASEGMRARMGDGVVIAGEAKTVSNNGETSSLTREV